MWEFIDRDKKLCFKDEEKRGYVLYDAGTID